MRDLVINAPITATRGNILACCGRDVIVNAPLTTTNGSILLSGGRDVRVFHALTTTDGNIALCAGHDVHIDAAVTLTRGTTIPAQSLGLPVGLTLIAGADGTGPGVGGGTIIFSPLAPPTTVTVAPTTIAYNPASYAAPTDFSTNFVLTEGATLTQRMLLFPNGGRVEDGTTATVLTGFNRTPGSGAPVGVTLVAGPGAVATFDSPGVGTSVGITYSGYTLAGPNADQYVLAGSCCVSTFRTTGTIIAAPPPPPPPPPATPPVVVSQVQPSSPTPTPIVIIAALDNDVDLVVFGEGIKMPVAEVAPVPLTPTPAGLDSPPVVAPGPAPVAPRPTVPVYKPKQDRN
ncbi:YDG domain-containing protein [Caulobacter sp. NIBR1757]|uniref:YDG domain-containing protein n=1 Tax=Caulobacter sp. NIBR1757 TaxID=3016000 RepID=UPI0022F0B186|nr:YDG domain-containing protein [Caulobacter sp. NIBR1757]WGM40304.1 hypothetical protein AMEJIAPC_03248 [Caulobacter sp. NIBR1757]